MYSPDDILTAAAAIRPYLPNLLGETAPTVDAQLADLLNQPFSPGLENRILDCLAAHDASREWLNQFLQTKRPPDVERHYHPLAGQATDLPAIPQYVCPEGDYVWYRHSIAEPVPLCPTHHQALILVEED
ncbi:hypothetical protein [Halomicronema sp. CCY15110]|uniref:hypothetical protein n=1 Tax=Halomicronema sp. CCY15110 TaxID=2767773 RepID=UPI00194FA359|nr:hypothetical protein [Halomicronema sp. CCY15110]